MNYFGADSSLYFRLGSDIDLSAYLSQSGNGYNNGCGWLPIEVLNGKLDGAGYCIRGLWIERPYEIYAGLINLCYGTIKRLGVEVDADKWITGWNYAGILCSWVSNRSFINDCYTKGRVRATDLLGGNNGMTRQIGGLAGDNSGTIQNCCSSADCIVEQKDTVVRYIEDGVGGLVGMNDRGSIIDCYAKGKITCKSSNAGGLAGVNKGTIINCYASGEVFSDGRASSAGDLAGENWQVDKKNDAGLITLSYATGNVTANGTLAMAGGLVGRMYPSSGGTIRDAFCTGNVSVSGKSAAAGGFIGNNYGVIENCYSVGAVSITGNDPSVGGFSGENYKSFMNCYYLKSDQINTGLASIGREYNTETPQSVNIYGKTNSELKLKGTFGGWNFDSVWTITETVTYPTLKNGLPTVVKLSGRASDNLQRNLLRIGNGTLIYQIPERQQKAGLILFDSKGQMVRKYSNIEGSGALRLEGMVSGIYLIEMRGQKGNRSFYKVNFIK